MRLWVDTDFGFDDLWALLLLRHYGATVEGISLVAGNTPLPQVIANALGAAEAYELGAPLHAGADKALVREVETAQEILGEKGMDSRGRFLPEVDRAQPPADAVEALAAWLMQDGRREVLALGPLTNIALLVQRFPEAAARITRLVWMGGSNGPGNHSPLAEFNALCDPEAAAIVAGAGLPLDVIDLMICRQAIFGPEDMPQTDPLTADLLGGYLDIGLKRGRAGMAIYDPVAALAMVRPSAFAFERQSLTVSTTPNETYGATRFRPDPQGLTRLPTAPLEDIARLCLDALRQEASHGLSE
ncbi:nucleoside hydrolase [Alloyangia pacifica]|uniref:Inosine-uridine nucleoside N-ribohydrolase n=1 Tax=Alloyangia pacifica TaxID=311180 RepID=A0A1I6QZL3_9RHOB|nr:nucleoside hydrolase [Alloyangia pacifica]SDG08247.1 Inosine-uridine nucleoside N-ribohydrolase [Alloyangia pacifica]SFS57917.1 Inosine-uridine nucleoside N-ribohydrolase [Alloyangia pacifica]